MPRRDRRVSSWARWSVMDGSFLVVVGYGSPTDTEHGFPAQLKGICTEASEILPERGPPGAAGVADGSGASVRRERSPQRTAFAAPTLPQVAPFRPPSAWFAGLGRREASGPEASCGEGTTVSVRRGYASVNL